MTMSGIILDVYDDPSAVSGEVHPSNMTPAMKTASRMTREELDQLPDSLYALCLYEGGDPPLRKYACVDRGHTELHVVAFLKQAGKLDEELRRTPRRT